jgi:hypothetical protein
VPDKGDHEVAVVSADYDLFVNGSYMSRLAPRSRRNAYLCYFPTPFDADLGPWRRTLIRALGRHVRARAGGGILEVGIGSGAQSALLSRRFATVSVDNDLRNISSARSNLRRFGPRTRVVAADAFVLPFRDSSFGVSLSQGLIEHFDDDSIGRLVREQLRTCAAVVFSVPSDNYPRQDVGNERLMPPERWRTIVERAAGPRYTVKSRYYRGDLEALKYSVLARRWLGSFSVLVTVDPAGEPVPVASPRPAPA